MFLLLAFKDPLKESGGSWAMRWIFGQQQCGGARGAHGAHWRRGSLRNVWKSLEKTGVVARFPGSRRRRELEDWLWRRLRNRNGRTSRQPVCVYGWFFVLFGLYEEMWWQRVKTFMSFHFKGLIVHFPFLFSSISLPKSWVDYLYHFLYTIIFIYFSPIIWY